MTLLAQIQAAEKLMSCQLKMGLVSEPEASNRQVSNLSDIIRKTPSIAQDDCTVLLEYLQEEH